MKDDDRWKWAQNHLFWVLWGLPFLYTFAPVNVIFLITLRPQKKEKQQGRHQNQSHKRCLPLLVFFLGYG